MKYDKIQGVPTFRDVVKDYRASDLFDQGTLWSDGTHRTRDINHSITAAYASQKNTPGERVHIKHEALNSRMPGACSGDEILHEQLKEVENKLAKQKAKKAIKTVSEAPKKATSKGLSMLKRLFIK